MKESTRNLEVWSVICFTNDYALRVMPSSSTCMASSHSPVTLSTCVVFTTAVDEIASGCCNSQRQGSINHGLSQNNCSGNCHTTRVVNPGQQSVMWWRRRRWWWWWWWWRWWWRWLGSRASCCSHAAKMYSSDASCTTTVALRIQTIAVNFDFGGCVFSESGIKAKDRLGQSKEGASKVVVVVVVVALVAAILMVVFII
jgi:hypothetical protein